jgi:hypothetical protein
MLVCPPHQPELSMSNLRFRPRIGPALAYLCAAFLAAPGPAATSARSDSPGHARVVTQDATISIPLPDDREVPATLRMPTSADVGGSGGAGRPPVVVLAAGPAGTGASIAGSSNPSSEAASLASALAAAGVASLRTEATDAATLAQWIAHLRNDERFPTVSVVASGTAVEAAIIAARAARADGVMIPSQSAAVATVAEEFARIQARAVVIPPTQSGEAGATDPPRGAAGPPPLTAAAIADLAKTTQPFGRRGTRATRPATKRGSPRRVLLATLGATRIGIEWGSPQKRGREIWGALVPWNNVWMPGADEATTITTNGPITIGNLELPAGDHTFYALPTADGFDLIVSRDVGQFHTVRAPELELGRVPMTVTTRAGIVEGLTFEIEPARGAGPAVLKLIWDDREYAVGIRPAG